MGNTFKSEQELYQMDLHDTLTTPAFEVMRVPGGWVYKYFSQGVSTVFVPFNNEFQKT